LAALQPSKTGLSCPQPEGMYQGAGSRGQLLPGRPCETGVSLPATAHPAAVILSEVEGSLLPPPKLVILSVEPRNVGSQPKDRP
jgi:hypothetical protein